MTRVTLPSGVRFHDLVGFADSEDIFDALSPEDGWREYEVNGTVWKDRVVKGGGKVTVFSPLRLAA